MTGAALGGHGAGYVAVLWLVVVAVFASAAVVALIAYRRAARKLELEEIDRLLEED